MTMTIEKHVDVRVPVGDAYASWWRSFETSELSQDLELIQRAGPQRYRWRARLAGVEEEWIAEITERIPGRRIAWTSRAGARNAGCVTFHRLGDRHTRVMLQLEFEPDGWLETLGAWVGVVDRRIDSALEEFKSSLESGEEPIRDRSGRDGARVAARRAPNRTERRGSHDASPPRRDGEGTS